PAAGPARAAWRTPPAVGEPQREPGEAVVAGLPAAFPVVATVDLGAVRVGDHDLAGHAEVNAQHRTAVRGVAPHALALAVSRGETASEQGRTQLTGHVRARHERVRVVDVDDAPLERGSFEHRPGGLDLRQFR